mgnify:CR=1 FL=1
MSARWTVSLLKELHDQVGIITLADVPDVFVAKASISGFAHWLPMPLTLALRALKGS